MMMMMPSQAVRGIDSSVFRFPGRSDTQCEDFFVMDSEKNDPERAAGQPATTRPLGTRQPNKLPHRCADQFFSRAARLLGKRVPAATHACTRPPRKRLMKMSPCRAYGHRRGSASSPRWLIGVNPIPREGGPGPVAGSAARIRPSGRALDTARTNQMPRQMKIRPPDKWLTSRAHPSGPPSARHRDVMTDDDPRTAAALAEVGALRVGGGG